MGRKVTFNNIEYNVESLNDECEKLLTLLEELENQLNERNNLIRVLHRARASYIQELKQLIITEKSGLDVFDL